MTTPRKLAAQIRPDPGRRFNVLRTAAVTAVNSDGTVQLDLPAAPTAVVVESCVVGVGDVVFFTASAAAPIVVGVASAAEPLMQELTITDANWANYGAGWAPLTVARSGHVVTLNGLLAVTGTPTAFETVATLPELFRPAENIILQVMTDTDISKRMDVYTDGRFANITVAAATPYIVVNASWFV